MNEKHWVESFYDTFMMRDLIGYAAPGSLLIMGLLCELDKTQFLKALITDWSGVVFLVIVSYIAATGLRLIGTIIPVLVLHRAWGLLGRGRTMGVPGGIWTRLERLLWRGDEERLRQVYGQIDEGERKALIDREVVFMHLTGLTGMAFLVLAVAVFFLNHDGLSKVLGISECTLIIALVLASIVFLLGHYRHTHQRQVLLKL